MEARHDDAVVLGAGVADGGVDPEVQDVCQSRSGDGQGQYFLPVSRTERHNKDHTDGAVDDVEKKLSQCHTGGDGCGLLQDDPHAVPEAGATCEQH